MTRSPLRARLVKRAAAGRPIWVPILVSGLAIVLITTTIGGWRGRSLAGALALGRGTAPSGSRSDSNTVRLMDALVSSRAEARKALSTIVAARDSRFVPVLIEVLRASQAGMLEAADAAMVIGALEALSGKQFGDDWPAWVEWYGTTALGPPPGFVGWKGRLFGRIDPRFRAFLSDDLPSRLRVEEIQWGGVGGDGIPALTHPRMVPASFATYLAPADPVFGLAIDGYARAYPLRIVDWHEMVNDRVGGTPISIAYCTLCGAGIAYEGRASDGRTYTFGSSGLLYRSNKMMYDHQTRTLWNQLTGEPVLGRLANGGVRLTLRPLVLSSWREWVSQHPETKVLDVRTGYDRVYAPGAAYGPYFASRDTMFPVWRRNRVLPPKARVFAIRIDGVPKAFPIDALVARRVVNDAVGSTPVVLIAIRGIITVAGQHEGGQLDRVRASSVAYSAGAEVRAFARGQQRFRPGPASGIVLDASGRFWRITEDALIGPDGVRAPRLPGFLAYWFAWYAFFPQTLIYAP